MKKLRWKCGVDVCGVTLHCAEIATEKHHTPHSSITGAQNTSRSPEAGAQLAHCAAGSPFQLDAIGENRTALRYYTKKYMFTLQLVVKLHVTVLRICKPAGRCKVCEVPSPILQARATKCVNHFSPDRRNRLDSQDLVP